MKTLSMLMLVGLATPALADANGADTLSSADVKALLDERKDDVGNEGYEKSYLECCGIDLKAKTVKAPGSMVSQRLDILKRLQDPSDSYGEGYATMKKWCEASPKIQVDLAVVVEQQGNGMPTSPVFEGFNGACGAPHNPHPAAKKFVQKIKTVHLKLLPDMSKKPSSGFVYSWDAKSGELTVFTFNFGASNIGDSFEEWLQKQ